MHFKCSLESDTKREAVSKKKKEVEYKILESKYLATDFKLRSVYPEATCDQT